MIEPRFRKAFAISAALSVTAGFASGFLIDNNTWFIYAIVIFGQTGIYFIILEIFDFDRLRLNLYKYIVMSILALAVLPIVLYVGSEYRNSAITIGIFVIEYAILFFFLNALVPPEEDADSDGQ